MAIYLVKCPSCGSATELNDEKESGFCTECGMKIITAEAELYVPEEEPVPAEEAPVPDLPAPAEEDAAAPDAALTFPPAEEAPAFVEVGPPLNNAEQLVADCFSDYSLQFMVNSKGVVNSTELTAALINEGSSLKETAGVDHAHGTA